MHSTSTLPSVKPAQTASPAHSVWGTSIRFTLVTAVLLGIGLSAGGHRHRRRCVSAPSWREASFSRTARSSARSCWRRASPPTATFIRGHPRPATATTPPPPADRTWLSQTRLWWTAFRAHRQAVRRGKPGKPVPIDLVTASGLGPRSRHHAGRRLLPGRSRGQGSQSER